LSSPCQLFQRLLNLLGDAFAAQFDAIVSEAAGVARGDENVNFVFGVLFTELGGEVG
jgi:hypothetical protein